MQRVIQNRPMLTRFIHEGESRHFNECLRTILSSS